MAAWELWEKALVPSLLSGAGSWVGNIDKAANFFWRLVLSVPESCPKIALRCETGMLGMKWRIWLHKISMVIRIKNKDEDALCKQVYNQEQLHGWPGLSSEVSAICCEIGIPDVNQNCVPYRTIKEAIYNHHYADMIKALESSTKLESIKHEDFRQPQSYMHDKSIYTGRLAFRIRSQMVDEIPENFKNKFKYDTQGLICKYCPSEPDTLPGMSCMAGHKSGVGLERHQGPHHLLQKMLQERTTVDEKAAWHFSWQSNISK